MKKKRNYKNSESSNQTADNDSFEERFLRTDFFYISDKWEYENCIDYGIAIISAQEFNLNFQWIWSNHNHFKKKFQSNCLRNDFHLQPYHIIIEVKKKLILDGNIINCRSCGIEEKIHLTKPKHHCTRTIDMWLKPIRL